MRESERHTLYSLRHGLYSLRHGFNDRLRETEAPDELKDELMGHDSKKPRYGDGHGLRLKLKYIEWIALAPGMQVEVSGFFDNGRLVDRTGARDAGRDAAATGG